MVSKNFPPSLKFVLLGLLVTFTQLLAQTKQANGPTFEETHGFIERMIVDKRIPYARLHSVSGEYHYDEYVWSVVLYSPERCHITYRRKLEISLYNDSFEIDYKTAKFDMTEVVGIYLQSMDKIYFSKPGLPSKDLVIDGPLTVWINGKNEEEWHQHMIVVSTLNSERILKAFQRLKELCPTPKDVF